MRADYSNHLVSVPEEPETARYINPAEKKIYINIAARRGAKIDRIVTGVRRPTTSAV